jgi:acylphosphatase
MATASRRTHLWIEGRVQGVWFRESTRLEAEAAGVTGWVRNLPDGRVEAVFEGEPAAVERLVRWVRRGPERAQVTGVELADEPPLGERGFRVR